MRQDPHRLRFEIDARDGLARAGVMYTAHGPIETPAFIPLATKGTVRGLESHEVAELGHRLAHAGGLGRLEHPSALDRAGGVTRGEQDDLVARGLDAARQAVDHGLGAAVGGRGDGEPRGRDEADAHGSTSARRRPA